MFTEIIFTAVTSWVRPVSGEMPVSHALFDMRRVTRRATPQVQDHYLNRMADYQVAE